MPTPPLSTLSLAAQVRPGERGRGSWVRTPRTALDFVVGGESLHERLGSGDVIGVLGWGLAERAHIAQLLLRDPPELPTGRVPIYVCPECGDPDCGALAVRVEETEAGFVWSDFTAEVAYYYDSPDERVQHRFESVGPFTFDKALYRDVIGGRLTALPETPPAVYVEAAPEAQTLLVTFADDERRLFRAAALLDQPAFRPLREPDAFSTAHVDGRGGVVWDAGPGLSRDRVYLMGEPVG